MLSCDVTGVLIEKVWNIILLCPFLLNLYHYSITLYVRTVTWATIWYKYHAAAAFPWCYILVTARKSFGRITGALVLSRIPNIWQNLDTVYLANSHGIYIRWYLIRGAHVRSNLCYLTYKRRLIRSRVGTNRVFLPEKTYFPSCMRNI